MQVIKRDGRLVPFKLDRIKNAINAARVAVKNYDLFLVDTVAGEVAVQCFDNIGVEQIQDLVEKELRIYGAEEVAVAYHAYREQRTKARNAKQDGIISEIISCAKNEVTRENANMNADTPAGMMMKIASERSKELVDDHLISEEAKKAVADNVLHIHDKDYYPTRSLTCLAENTHITLMLKDGSIVNTTLAYLSKFFENAPSKDGESVIPDEYVWIQGRNGWTKITGITRRLMNDTDSFYHIKTAKGVGLRVTGTHLIPVITKNGEVLKQADDIRVGDLLVSAPVFNPENIGNEYLDLVDLILKSDMVEKSEVIITNIKDLSLWLKYKYHINSLSKYIGSKTYRRGTSYLTLQDFAKLRDELDLCDDVMRTLRVKMFDGKDSLPLYLPVTNELVEIIGYLHSDGSVCFSQDTGNYQFAFTNASQEINKRFEKAFRNTFSNHLNVRYNNGKEYGWLFSSKLLAGLFKFVLGKQLHSADIAIPDFIINGTEEIKWHYISALFDGDGCVNGTDRAVRYTSVCRHFAEQLVMLLKSVGVEAAINTQETIGQIAKFSNGVTAIRNYNTTNVVITSYEYIDKFLTGLCCVKRNSISTIYAAKPAKAMVSKPNQVKSKLNLDKSGVVVYDLETVEHWYCANHIVVHNCIQHPIDKILGGGFQAGHGESRSAKRIETASILSAISMETIQNEMHGGQAIPAFDFYLAPYVRKTYQEEVKKLTKLFGNLDGLMDASIDDYVKVEVASNVNQGREDASPTLSTMDILDLKQYAINNTVDRVHQAMEAFIHNMNTIHSRGGNQVVFSSINYGTDTSAEGRCVIRELLNSTYRGVGNGSTAIFPIQIMKMKDGVNKKPGDPNYDLYQLGCKVTAKRFFPNFLNLDATFNQNEQWKADDPQRFRHEVATMGCVCGDEVVTYSLNGQLHVEPFMTMWSLLKREGKVRKATDEGYGAGEYIDLEGLNVKIADRDKMVDCLRIIKNPDQGNWCSVVMSNGRRLTCTEDHPWSIQGKGVVLTRDLVPGDEVECISSQTYTTESKHTVEEAWFRGFFICDGCYDGQFMATVGLDEQDIVERYSSVMQEKYGVLISVHRQLRGEKGNYFELKAPVAFSPVKAIVKNLRREFVGLAKNTRQFPVWVFQSNEEVRAAFLAGIVDADGYINNKRDRAKVQVGSVNKMLALQTMMLAQSLGVPAKVYENHYSSIRPQAIRYRVEFDAFPLLIKYMASEKKKANVTSFYNTIDITSGKIQTVTRLGSLQRPSYDVTTSSEHFNVSGIRSHNCRTRVFENRHGEKTSIGRGNLSFSTMNLPGLALSVMGIKDEGARLTAFFNKLEELIGVTGRQLINRYKFQSEALAKQFPLLMSGMWVGSEGLRPDDKVAPVLKHGTLGVGFIGLAECLIALVGKHHGESETAQQLGLSIVKFIKRHVDALAQKHDLNFSVLATPAEGLSGKFTKKDKEKYGIVPGVTDKGYYTNSNHVPVYYHCSAKHKAEIEGPYHELTGGGHIFYVELDGDATHNIQAIDDIVKLMDKYNIGYASVNHNRNRCMNCGYEDAKPELSECPVCGSHEIDRLQRITGYLVGTTDRWNHGKLAELKDRIVHER